MIRADWVWRPPCLYSFSNKSKKPPQPLGQFWALYLQEELVFWARFSLVVLVLHADVDWLVPCQGGHDCPQSQEDLPPLCHDLLQRGACDREYPIPPQHQALKMDQGSKAPLGC